MLWSISPHCQEKVSEMSLERLEDRVKCELARFTDGPPISGAGSKMAEGSGAAAKVAQFSGGPWADRRRLRGGGNEVESRARHCPAKEIYWMTDLNRVFSVTWKVKPMAESRRLRESTPSIFPTIR